MIDENATQANASGLLSLSFSFASILHLRLSRICEDCEKTTRKRTDFLHEISSMRVVGAGAEEGLWSTYESFIVALDNGDYFIYGGANPCT